MSYYTRVTFEFSDEPAAAAEVATVARKWLTDQNVYAVEPVVEDLLRGLKEGQTDFSDLASHDIEGMMTSISARWPSTRFFVRGMGEEFSDVWLRQFEGGEVVYKVGPFDEDLG